MPTRRPVNGPGPQPTTTASSSSTVSLGVGQRANDIRRQLLGVRAGVDGDPLGEHLDVLAVDAGRRPP